MGGGNQSSKANDIIIGISHKLSEGGRKAGTMCLNMSNLLTTSHNFISSDIPKDDFEHRTGYFVKYLVHKEHGVQGEVAVFSVEEVSCVMNSVITGTIWGNISSPTLARIL